MSQYLIPQSHNDVSKPTPWPVLIDEDGTVISGLGQDDGSHLLGFQKGEQQSVVLWFKDFQVLPATAVGLVPVFTKRGEGMFAQHPEVDAVEERS